MPEQILPEPPPPYSNPSQNFSTEFDCLPIPPLDPLFFSTDPNSTAANASDPFLSDLGFGLGLEDDTDFDFTFDDLDDLFFPSENEDFLISDGIDPATGSFQSLAHTDAAPESDFSKEFSGYRISNADNVLNSGSPESGSSQISGDRGLDIARVLSCPSPESGNSDRELSGGPVSSQGSGNCGSGVSNLGNFDRDVLSNVAVDQKIKMEEIGMMGVSKRKKEKEDPNSESRTTKCRRSSTAENANSQFSLNATDEEEEKKKKARLTRNRESAQLSRQRKKHYVDELEDKVRTMHSTIVDLKSKISYVMAENSSLRLKLSNGGGSMCPPPPPGMYPTMTPMAYPWVPYAPYVVNPQGSQVPLVPIPRLKPQQPVSPSKSKKTENKKIKRKTKKVASISFLGLLFFIFLFGGLVPVVNVKFGGIGDGRSGYVSDRFYDQYQGRVFRVNGHLNGSNGSIGVGFSNGKVDIGNRLRCERAHTGGTVCDVAQKDRGSQHTPGSDEFVRLGNDSELLVASLYVPRNDKLVKIDGNLIINSVLASEKAMASCSAPEANNTETSLAIASDLAPASAIPKGGRNIGRHSHMDGSPTERQRAITSGLEDTLKGHLKSTTTDSKMQQWFREDLAEPLLHSGMCTEVFQFDVSSASAPGALIPASEINNITVEQPQNTTHLKKGRNRRILRGFPFPLARSNVNISEEHDIRNSQKDKFQGNKSSSMVVSVLFDPREASDSGIDGTIVPKSLSRIFVVVLLDGVKYVTYSCMLPMSGPHLVTT